VLEHAVAASLLRDTGRWVRDEDAVVIAGAGGVGLARPGAHRSDIEGEEEIVDRAGV
jgi:hypothetical protein